jgi:hypothetical protein
VYTVFAPYFTLPHPFPTSSPLPLVLTLSFYIWPFFKLLEFYGWYLLPVLMVIYNEQLRKSSKNSKYIYFKASKDMKSFRH